MGKRYFGSADIKVDGVLYETKEDATLDPGGPVRTVRKGARVYGFGQTEEESVVTCSIFLSATTTIDDIRNADNVTIEFLSDIGLNFMVRGAWFVGGSQINAGTGEWRVTFNGPPAVQV